MPVKRRPAGYLQAIGTAELSNILAAYDLGAEAHAHHVLFEHPSPVHLSARTKTARKIFVDAPSGAFFIKQIPWYCDEPRLNRFRQGWIDELHAAGVPVPMPLRARDGTGWAEVDDARFTVTRAIVGRAWTGGEGELAAAMALLASLHAVPPPHRDLATNEDYFDLVRDHIDLCQALLNEAGKDDRDRIAASFGPRLARLRARAHEAGWEALSRTGIHGDFSPWNIVLSADGAHALACDFDNADYAQRLHDVAEMMFSFGLLRYRDRSTNFDSTAHFSPIHAAVRPLRLYHGLAPLDLHEQAALPAVAEAFAIEVYCLGLMRDDFSIDQLPVMIAELDRLGRELPDLFPIEAEQMNVPAAPAPDFDRCAYRFDARAGRPCRAVQADFRHPDRWAELDPANTGAICIMGGCACRSDAFVHAAAPRMVEERLELPEMDGLTLLSAVELGDPADAVAAVLRRTKLPDRSPLVVLDCTGCGANTSLVAQWDLAGAVRQSITAG